MDTLTSLWTPSAASPMEDSSDRPKKAKPVSSGLSVNRGSIKSRSSNCLADAMASQRGPPGTFIAPWLPGLSLVGQPSTSSAHSEALWANFRFPQRLSRDETSSASNYDTQGALESQQTTSDKQRLKGSSRRKRYKRGGRRKGDLLALESGKDDELSPLGRKVIGFVAVGLLLLCILLVGVTLRMGPVIDEMVRKGNEDIYRSMSAGASTSSPTTDGAANITSNSTVPSTGPPG